MQEPDYEIVASTENTPYLLWQALLFHASCVQTQGVAPTIVVHGDGPLLPGFRALGELGARVVSAPSYRASDGVEYTCRNTAGSLLEAKHDRPWTLICDPDFLFLDPLPKTAASLCDGCPVSWDLVSYMQVGDFNRRWLTDSCRERGIDPVRIEGVRTGGVVPNLVRADVHREFAPLWVSAVDTLVRVARRDGDVPWVTIAWGFALAAWELGLDLGLTRLTHTTHGGSKAPASSFAHPILHYCYGDEIFDKRRHRAADSAASVWTLEKRGRSVSDLFVERVTAIRAWFSERGIDVTDPDLYEPIASKANNGPAQLASKSGNGHSSSNGHVYHLDSLPFHEAAVGYGSLGTHGSLGYGNQHVSVGGESFEHSLSSHAPARLVFELGRRYARFRTRVALNDDVPAGATHASFSVTADGRLLAVAPQVVLGVPQTLEARVDGVERLELRVETTRFEHCHAVWLDPELRAGDDPAPEPRTLVDCLDRTEITLPERPHRAKRCIATVASAGFAGWLDDLLGSIRANANCPDALLVVFVIGADEECERVAELHGALTVACARRGPKNSTLKSLLYSAARVIDAEQFVCLDADMLVVGDLSPIFASLEACTNGSLLACREANSRYYRDVEHALTTVYYGSAADLERIQGTKSDDGSYPLVVNDGLFAGDREALLLLDGVIRSWPGAPAWVDELPYNSWRNQLVFNLGMARLRSGVELDPGYNVQLYWHDADVFEKDGCVRASFRGRPARVLHFNGTSRTKYPEWRGLFARSGNRRIGPGVGPGTVEARDEGRASTLAPEPPVAEPRPIRGFMNVCCIGHYEEVLGEILESLLESRLYEKTVSIDIALLGSVEAQRVVERMLAPFDRFRIVERSEHTRQYEYPALLLLQQACQDFGGAVYYLHTKGVSHGSTDSYQRYWRRLMLHHVVEHHEECLAALDTHACAGTGFKGDHYSGNFWWAKAEHIRSLPDLAGLRRAPRRVAWDPANDVRFQCEYWLGMTKAPFKSIGPEHVHLHENIRWTHSATEVVNDLLRAVAGRHYLELAPAGASVQQVEAEIRHIVSPDENATFRMSESEFRAASLGEATYDVVLVGSVHDADRCLDVMEWALGRLGPHGALVVHNTNPPTEWHQRPASEHEPGSDWNGDAWKAVVRFRLRHPELDVVTVDSDWGCTVVRRSQRSEEGLAASSPADLTWEGFEQHRSAWLNLISVPRFRRDLIHLPPALGQAVLGSRTDLLNALISRFGLERYLEIGVGAPRDNFERIVAPVRQSVDPDALATFRMTSDEFFARGLGCETYDLVFVDGLHEEEQCLRDIENSLRRLSRDGYIVVHDANPPSEWHQRPLAEFEPGSLWNGTVWKAIVRFRERNPNHALFTVDFDWGCAVIRGSPRLPEPLSPPPPKELDWSLLDRHRRQWLNLVSVEDFRGLLLA